MHDDLTGWQHGHSFGQEVRRPGEGRTLLVIAITATMMVVEIVAGLAFASMALLADGLHMASHTAALGIAAFAYVYARRHASDPRYTFGTGKVNALGGFTGAVLLAAFAVFMAAGSVDRLVHPVTIAFDYAIAVAVAGLVVNGVCAVILSGGQDAHGHAGAGEHAPRARRTTARRPQPPLRVPPRARRRAHLGPGHRGPARRQVPGRHLDGSRDGHRRGRPRRALVHRPHARERRRAAGQARATGAAGDGSSRASRRTATAGSRTSTCGPSGRASTPPR